MKRPSALRWDRYGMIRFECREVFREKFKDFYQQPEGDMLPHFIFKKIKKPQIPQTTKSVPAKALLPKPEYKPEYKPPEPKQAQQQPPKTNQSQLCLQQAKTLCTSPQKDRTQLSRSVALSKDGPKKAATAKKPKPKCFIDRLAQIPQPRRLQEFVPVGDAHNQFPAIRFD